MNGGAEEAKPKKKVRAASDAGLVLFLWLH